MGLCLSLDEEDKKARARSDEIDRKLHTLAKEEQGVIKILLLGAGESGKSTLVKQMKIIHNNGFTEEELLSFRPAVLDNLLSSMKFVLSGMGLLRINLDNQKNRNHAQTVLSCHRGYDENLVMPYHVKVALKNLWNDAGVRRAVARGYEYELNDSAVYYFDNIDRICVEKFRPSQLDVLRVRIRTQGIIETCFKLNNILFRMFDVGGQRSERNKWIQCFDDVRAILYVASLSGYDMTLHEDQSVNRLEESLRLFGQLIKNPFFRKTTMILFLNKLDLFREKIEHSTRHLKYYFPEYKGPEYSIEPAAMFVQHMFLYTCRNEGRVTYSHFTTATDTRNIQIVFQVVMDTIIRENLQAAKLL